MGLIEKFLNPDISDGEFKEFIMSNSPSKHFHKKSFVDIVKANYELFDPDNPAHNRFQLRILLNDCRRVMNQFCKSEGEKAHWFRCSNKVEKAIKEEKWNSIRIRGKTVSKYRDAFSSEISI